MTLALHPDVFSLFYEPGSNILRGRWPGLVPLAQLPACYEAMLTAAQMQGNCHFWLLDMRPRNWHSAEFAHWFTTAFVARAVATLGQPLFIAYLVADEQQVPVESAATEDMLRQAATVNCYPFYFRNEAAALSWLHDQQAADQPAVYGNQRRATAAR